MPWSGDVTGPGRRCVTRSSRGSQKVWGSCRRQPLDTLRNRLSGKEEFPVIGEKKKDSVTDFLAGSTAEKIKHWNSECCFFFFLGQCCLHQGEKPPETTQVSSFWEAVRPDFQLPASAAGSGSPRQLRCFWGLFVSVEVQLFMCLGAAPSLLWPWPVWLSQGIPGHSLECAKVRPLARTWDKLQLNSW